MEVYKPEDGMAFVEQDANGPCHYYTLKGERIPFSLTQILELSGMSRQPTEPSEIAARPAKAKLGTKVHEYTLWLDQGELDLDDLKPYPAYYNRVLGWQQFKEDFHFEPCLPYCEIPMGVRLNGMLYGMKLDAYGIMTGDNGKLSDCVVEKKCSVNLEASYQLQTAGQAIAFKDQADRSVMTLRRFCVQLFEKENAAKRFYKVVEHTDRNDEKIFVGAALANAYWRLNNGLLKGI